jgi:hypothetical protein
MDTNQPAAIGLNDMGQLTMRGNVAFAVRCARRMRPCLDLLDNTPSKQEQLAAIDAAIEIAAAFCRGLPAATGRAAAAAQLAGAVAAETGKFTRHAGYAAVRAVEAAAYAEEGIRNSSEGGKIEVVAAAFGAGRVLTGNVDTFALDLVLAALFSDVKLLKEMAHGTCADLGLPIESSAAGPLGQLWPAGTPGCFAPVKRSAPTDM